MATAPSPLILVPRPAPHLPRTLAALRNAGFTNLLPLELSHPATLPAAIPHNATALILTSILALRPGLPPLPCYCVGESTAAAARAMGLHVAYAGDENAAALCRHLAALPPQHFAHLHGDNALMQWHEILKNSGHAVTAVPAYAINHLAALPPPLLADISAASHTLLFSAGSAEHLANLLKNANIHPTPAATAFSPAVAAAARAFWPAVAVAERPTLAAMCKALKAAMQQKATL